VNSSVEIIGSSIIKVTIPSSDPAPQNDIKEVEYSRTTNISALKSIMIVSAVSGALLFGSAGVQAQTVSNTITTSQISNNVSGHGLEGRLAQINSRGINSGNSRNRENMLDQKGVVQFFSGDPFAPSEIMDFSYQKKFEDADSSKIKSLELSDAVSVSIFAESAYYKLSVSSEKLEKRGHRLMNHSPTFIRLYADDLTDTVTVNPIKLGITAAFAAVTAWLGPDVLGLINGLIIFALVDLILGMIPGNIKPGAEKDQKIQAKFLTFITNFLSIIAFIKGSEYLRGISAAQDITTFIATGLYYIIIAWIFSTYTWRIVGFVARSNKTKVPKILRDLFDKDVTKGS